VNLIPCYGIAARYGDAMEHKTVRRAECSQCSGQRNCEILTLYKEKGSDGNFDWSKTWYILKCQGCDNIFAQTVSTNSEELTNFYEENGDTGTEYIETIVYWPALLKRNRPEWMGEFGICGENTADLDAALIELYAALDNDLNILSAIGIRTSFDIASEMLGVRSDQSFRGKLEELVRKGHIGELGQARLEALVDAGSASAHRGWRPKAAELNVMMELLEHFIHRAFVAPVKDKQLDAKALEMRAKVPPRKMHPARS
jgi:hypothetical protein